MSALVRATRFHRNKPAGKVPLSVMQQLSASPHSARLAKKAWPLRPRRVLEPRGGASALAGSRTVALPIAFALARHQASATFSAAFLRRELSAKRRLLPGLLQHPL